MSLFFFFNDTATTEIYTLSLHDALPICGNESVKRSALRVFQGRLQGLRPIARKGRADHQRQSRRPRDRKSTRLNSSHLVISYAVFCLKKKKKSKKHYSIHVE